MLLTIRYFGDPVLRKVCFPVEKITSEIRLLVSNMIETMDSLNGVGLAANQVGELYKIFVIRPEIKSPNGDFILGPPEVYINPVISSPSEETEVMTEGCLSFPGLHLDVSRPVSIYIEAMDLDGKIFSSTVSGFKARELMHENDHINGRFFIDRISPALKKEIEPALRDIKKKYKAY